MKSSILIVIFDFFVCALLLSVETDPATAGQSPGGGLAVDAASSVPLISSASIEAMEKEWELEYAEIEKEAVQQLQDRNLELTRSLEMSRLRETRATEELAQQKGATVELQKQVQTLETQVTSQQKRIEGLGGGVGFGPIFGARIEAKVSITELDWGPDPHDILNLEAHPVVFGWGDERAMILPAAKLGLDWGELTERTGSRLGEYKITLARRGENPVSEVFFGSLEILQEHPDLVLIRLPAAFAETKPLQVVGRRALIDEGLDKGTIFKIDARGTSFDVSFSPELNDPRFIGIRNPVTNQPWDVFSKPEDRPAIGDCILTRNNRLVGVMVDADRALVLDEATMSNILMTLPAADKDKIPDAAKKWREQREK